MFCIKCGKRLGDSSLVCDDCIKGETSLNNGETESFFTPASEIPVNLDALASENIKATKKLKGTRAEGVGTSIASLTLAYIGYIVGIVGLIFTWLMFFVYHGSDGYSEYADFMPVGYCGAIFVIVGIIMAIIALSKGIKSMKIFHRYDPKPFATFVIGLLGLEFSRKYLIACWYNAVIMSFFEFILSSF